MLHAFDKSTGQEVFGYVPGAVASTLNKLTNETALDYQSYVDAPPTIRDAFINGSWRRVLVGTLRLGGQGVFAIDITNGVPNSESALASQVLWEFTDKSTNGADLGFTFGQVEITRLANREWVALVPGGYNSDVADGTVGSGNAVLYVLRLRDGSVLRKFDLGAGSSGLMTPIAGDYSIEGDTPASFDDYTDVTDLAFAGDLNGDIWRFDFQATTPGGWSVVKFFDGPANQPITVQPRIMRTRHPQILREFIVLFGTGKYIEPTDRVPGSGGQQAFYGIFDRGKNGVYPITQAQLFQQTITTSGGLRTLTTNQLPASGARDKGWFMNLPDTGERNITTSVFRSSDKSVIFSTLVPRSDDPCQPAVDSWLMIIDGQTGGAPGTFAAGIDDNGDGFNDRTDTALLSAGFDTNGDGQINTSDITAAAGKKFTDAIPTPTPVTLPGGGIAEIILPQGRIAIPDYQWRRRSWRELNSDE
ncbi:MAG: hypothetical protein IPK97_14835 [Ahniella sp.]|nr:hypothetical protein [Ahniella sp.]